MSMLDEANRVKIGQSVQQAQVQIISLLTQLKNTRAQLVSMKEAIQKDDTFDAEDVAVIDECIKQIDDATGGTMTD